MKLIQLIRLAPTLIVSAASAAVLTNADIVKMSQAKLDESIILAAIENSEPKFDTSAQGLIELSTAKVSEAAIAAIIKRGNAPPQATATAATTSATSAVQPTSDLVSPSEVFFIDGNQTTSMRYLNPQMRTAARGLGFGGFASYAVLRGTAASFRTKNTQPTFLVSVPNQAQPESYLTLASFAVRPNGSREVMIGGGFISYSTGIHPDRVIGVTSEKAADQSKAQKGFTIYRVTPKRALQPGQYAVILYTGEMQGLVGTWFTGAGNSYFDFGVEAPSA